MCKPSIGLMCFSLGFAAFYLPLSTHASLTYPYTVDEKPQVLFGDSLVVEVNNGQATTTYYGLENYKQDYVNGYAHIAFTYTHGQYMSASYPPEFYVTPIDPRTANTQTENWGKVIYSSREDETGWYQYDIQFDAKGYRLSVRRSGAIDIHVEQVEISGLKETSWVAIANYYPPAGNDKRYSVSFTPMPVKQAGKGLDPVLIIPGIMGSAYKDGELVIDPILHTYDDLIDTLLANGYEKDKTLFTFPYEWRNSNTYTAGLLGNKIDEIKEICDCEKVDLVAHSMGGLVARWYIQQTSHYRNNRDVDQLIFLGTPHRGSPKSYLQWEAGESDTDLRSDLVQSFFSAEAIRKGYKNVYSYIHNYPIRSVPELLPIFDYIKDNETGMMRKYPDNYPENNFLEVLDETIDFLNNSEVRINNIAGDSGDDNTIEIIRVVPTTKTGLWEHGQPEKFYSIIGDNGLERGEGDNTVTLGGAELSGSEKEKVTASHNNLPSVTKDRVYKILSGKDAKILINNGQHLSKKVLLMQLLSPIDFVVIAPDGKRVGKNFQTGEEYSEIPGAFYSGYRTNEEYITILEPLDGEYEIEVQGTGVGGKYGVMTSYITDDFSTTTVVTGITETNQITNLEVVVNNENPDSLNTIREVTLEVFLKDIEGAYNLGWIKDEGAKNKILRRAEKLEKFKGLLDKDLDVLYKVGRITKEAYNLFKEDLSYLINN